jgi:hypothetical protein
MRTLLSLVLSFFVVSTLAFGKTPIKILESKYSKDHLIPKAKLIAGLQKKFNATDYREVRAQVIFNEKQEPDHLLVYLHSKKFHRVDLSAVKLDSNYNLLTVIKSYEMQDEDKSQQPGIDASRAKCPDESVEVIAICPNDNDFEQEITDKVVVAARAKGLKTVKLDYKNGTRTNWLNYMTCPKLKGNFYDGDSNPTTIVTSDGSLSASELGSTLTGQFKYNVTNIWVACQAFKDPMGGTMMTKAQSRKYAAGINNLQVGPSDDAAVCTMQAAFDGKPMTESFHACYKQFDNEDDQWGFDGKGTDYFN